MPLEQILSDIEARALGCLLEKQATTPDYYPLTLNALAAACNQKSNRDPIMRLDDSAVLRVTEDLQAKRLCGEHNTAGSRMIKYGHNIGLIGEFSDEEKAVLAVLLLRGPQTVGELRGRTGRYHEFAELAQVEAVLQSLASREDGALVARLPRLAGRKEGRYAHLLSGPIEAVADAQDTLPGDPVATVQAEGARIAMLEEQVQAVQCELTELKAAFESFRSKFE
jgi:uncharacterized protein YceH (UPF0502 family)